MLDIIDNLSGSNFPENYVLVSFNVVNMFTSIDNEAGIKADKKVLNNKESKNPPTECILEALRICLQCSNSVFNDKNFIQTDDTAHGPHMSCSCSDTAMTDFDNRTENQLSNPKFGNASEMTSFSVWANNINNLPAFLDYLDNIGNTGEIKFIM